MSLNQEDRIHLALHMAPEGLTLEKLAERVGTKPKILASRMSKLHMYGRVGRARVMQENGSMGTIWRSGY